MQDIILIEIFSQFDFIKNNFYDTEFGQFKQGDLSLHSKMRTEEPIFLGIDIMTEFIYLSGVNESST